MRFLASSFHRQLLKHLNNPFPLISDKLGTISHSLRCNLHITFGKRGEGGLFVLPLINTDFKFDDQLGIRNTDSNDNIHSTKGFLSLPCK